jgi:hypothetical protein
MVEFPGQQQCRNPPHRSRSDSQQMRHARNMRDE